jgi:hypothetical protein
LRVQTTVLLNLQIYQIQTALPQQIPWLRWVRLDFLGYLRNDFVSDNPRLSPVVSWFTHPISYRLNINIASYLIHPIKLIY